MNTKSKRIYKGGGNPAGTDMTSSDLLNPHQADQPATSLSETFNCLTNPHQYLKMASGSCACRYIRYTTTSPPTDNGFSNCHCIECRKQSGAPYQAWLDFPTDSIKWNVEPTIWRSSETASRTFCPRCGSTMTMVLDKDPSSTGVAAGTLDVNSEHLVPRAGKHIFYKERAGWFVAPDDGSKKFDVWGE